MVGTSAIQSPTAGDLTNAVNGRNESVEGLAHRNILKITLIISDFFMGLGQPIGFPNLKPPEGDRMLKSLGYWWTFTACMWAAMAWAFSAGAHPVIYKGGYVGSVMLHSDYSQLHATYSLSSKVAAGATYESYRLLNQGTLQEHQQYVYGQLNGLVKRFYQDDSQGNIYVKGGLGIEPNTKKMVQYAGTQMDWETRTFYSAIATDTILTDQQIARQSTQIRLGLSPYEAKYDEIQAWLLFQWEHQRNDHVFGRLSPMMRFFYKTALWELGSDLYGRWLMHMMIHI